MVIQRRGNPKVNGASAIEKKIKRGNAQRQASGWKRTAGSLLWCAAVVCVLLTLGWWYFTLDNDVTETLVSRREVLQQPKVFPVQCSEDYENHKRFPGCTPQSCGRAVTDTVVTKEEALTLRQLAERGLSLGGSEGGASILDLHSGALSMGKQFVNIYKYSSGDEIKDIFSKEDFDLYRDVRSRIQRRIAETFGVDSSHMYLTKPTFFSRINSTEAKTAHDEYWHPHIDKVQYHLPPVSTSTQAQCSVSRQGEVAGRKVTVVDTPDWFSPAFSERLRRDVRLCMKLSNPGPHVFLLVIPVDTLEGEEGNIPDKMEDIFGETCWEHTVILFTSTDGMSETSVEELIQRQNLELLVERCENKHHLLDPNACGANDSLLRKIEAVVTGNNGEFYNSQLYLEAENVLREIQRKKEERVERRKRVEKEKAQQLDKTLQDSLKKVENEIKEREGEIQALGERMSALERKIEEEQDERKIRALERELKKEADQREQVERKMSELKENSDKERKEMEAKFKMEMEELKERYKREVKAEKERNLMKIVLAGFRKRTSSTKPIMEKRLIPDTQQLIPIMKDVLEGRSERHEKEIEKMCVDMANLSQSLLQRVRNSAKIHFNTEE